MSLSESLKAALNSGNRQEFRRCVREIADYARKYRCELRMTREKVEEMKTDALEMEKLYAEEDCKQQQLIRIRREIEKLKRESYEAVKKADARGQLKWN